MTLRKNAKIELIKNVPLFSRCSKRELEAVAAEADELTLPEGTALATQNARGSEFVVIIDGSADVRKNGRRIGRLGSGDFLGEIALISGAPHGNRDDDVADSDPGADRSRLQTPDPRSAVDPGERVESPFGATASRRPLGRADLMGSPWVSEGNVAVLRFGRGSAFVSAVSSASINTGRVRLGSITSSTCRAPRRCTGWRSAAIVCDQPCPTSLRILRVVELAAEDDIHRALRSMTATRRSATRS